MKGSGRRSAAGYITHWLRFVRVSAGVPGVEGVERSRPFSREEKRCGETHRFALAIRE
jgi:hypothetical protein